MDPSYSVLVGEQNTEGCDSIKKNNDVPLAVLIAVPIAAVVAVALIAVAVVYFIPKARLWKSIKKGKKTDVELGNNSSKHVRM